MKRFNVKNIITVIAGAILVTSCGTSNSKQYSAAPKGFTPSSTVAGLSSQAQQSIFGNYTTTLIATDFTGENDGSYPVTLSIGTAQISGNSNTYVNLTMTSNGGPTGSINDSELLQFNQAGTATTNGETRYVFYTAPNDLITGLANTAVELEIDVFLTSANQVDSSQSQIVIYDCGYAGTCSDASTYQEAYFTGLVKH